MTDTKSDPRQAKRPVTVIFDGANTAAKQEVRFLKSRNRDNNLLFVDLATDSDSIEEYCVSAANMKEKLIVQDAAGKVFCGKDALYSAHAVIGLAAWYEMCRLPGLLSVGTGIRPKS
jgi:predicted DCC family thiol-disulfide oxidoreductase YuxK